MPADYPFQIALWFLMLSVSNIRLYWHGYATAQSGEKKVPTKGEGSFRILRPLLGIPMATITFAFLFHPPLVSALQLDLPLAARWSGLAIGLLSCALLLWVHKHLAGNFTGTVHVRKQGGLVTTGPYAYVRHPMYYVFVLLFGSIFLLTANWALGIGYVIMMIGLTIRTPIEEQRLLEKYGKDYEEYKKRVGLWPRF